MRKPLIVLGREIGTYNGWSELDNCAIVAHEFKPTNGFPLTVKDLHIDYNRGKFECYNDNGDCIMSDDIIETINHFEYELDIGNAIVSQKID